LVETFEYNAAGQRILFIDARGARTQFCYYPENGPSGARDPNEVHCDATQAGGYLARQVRDAPGPGRRIPSAPANLITEFNYDAVGNLAAIGTVKGTLPGLPMILLIE
jgi:hypothetical protein